VFGQLYERTSLICHQVFGQLYERTSPFCHQVFGQLYERTSSICHQVFGQLYERTSSIWVVLWVDPSESSAELSDTGGIKVLKWKLKCSSWNLYKIKNIIS
jgi:hypothetical protein